MPEEPGPVEVMLLVTRVFDELGTPYVVAGSMASIVHGIVRTTEDADLVADLRATDVGPLVAALAGAFYIEEGSIREAISRRGCFNVMHLETMFKVDVYIPRGRPFDALQLRRGVRETVVPGGTVRIATAEDTLLGKLEWFRMGGEVSERQWRDVLGILKTQGDRLDLGYMREWGAELKVLDLVERALVAVTEEW